MSRKPEGDRPLTAAERQARRRQQKALERDFLIRTLERIGEAPTLEDARWVAATALKVTAAFSRVWDGGAPDGRR